MHNTPSGPHRASQGLTARRGLPAGPSSAGKRPLVGAELGAERPDDRGPATAERPDDRGAERGDDRAPAPYEMGDDCAISRTAPKVEPSRWKCPLTDSGTEAPPTHYVGGASLIPRGGRGVDSPVYRTGVLPYDAAGVDRSFPWDLLGESWEPKPRGVDRSSGSRARAACGVRTTRAHWSTGARKIWSTGARKIWSTGAR